jgi:TPP-dependent pyruvate/acetoin dehydrogenase alpha subunit
VNTAEVQPDTRVASPQQRLEWLASMLLIRHFEEAAEKASLRGKVPGGLHPAIGQEAVAVGVARALESDDVVTSGHRPHHHALARGVDPGTLMAELFGRATGLCHGRAGSMHIADFGKAYFGANGIVGAGLGLAMGAALAAKMRRVPQVAVGFFGDGGANTGRTWEFVNMASIWSLPLIIVCENNLYAVETHTDRVTGGKSITRRAEGFGLPSYRIDGQDIEAVHAAASAARTRAVSGDGPTFLEVMTYRYHGHETGDKGAYRTIDEIELWQTRDPIDRLAAAMTKAAQVSATEVAAIEKQAEDAVQAALAFADASPWPDPSEAFGTVAEKSEAL